MMKSHTQRNPSRAVAALAALALALPMAGCLSFSLADPEVKSTATVSYETVKDASNKIQEIAPTAKRVWPQSAELSFSLVGSIKEAEVSHFDDRHGARQRLAFGFFPGAANDDGVGAQVGTALRSIWYNIFFLGTPTVSGLLVEPFIYAEDERGSTFSRSALFGFHRWRAKPSVENPVRRKTAFREVVQLKDYSCTVAHVPASADGEGICRVSGIPADAKTIEVTLDVPPRHPLREKLAPFLNNPMTIRIQE